MRYLLAVVFALCALPAQAGSVHCTTVLGETTCDNGLMGTTIDWGEMFPEGAPVSESHWNDGTDCTTIYGDTTCTRIDIPAPRD